MVKYDDTSIRVAQYIMKNENPDKKETPYFSWKSCLRLDRAQVPGSAERCGAFCDRIMQASDLQIPTLGAGPPRHTSGNQDNNLHRLMTWLPHLPYFQKGIRNSRFLEFE